MVILLLVIYCWNPVPDWLDVFGLQNTTSSVQWTLMSCQRLKVTFALWMFLFVSFLFSAAEERTMWTLSKVTRQQWIPSLYPWSILIKKTTASGSLVMSTGTETNPMTSSFTAITEQSYPHGGACSCFYRGDFQLCEWLEWIGSSKQLVKNTFYYIIWKTY